MLKVDVLKTTVEIPSSCINVMINSSLQKRMNENRHIIRQIVRAVIYLAKQGLPLRGDVEDINGVKNPGHFLALLKDYASKDEILYQHLHFPKARNATYMSSTTQNDIINVIGYDLLLNTIISEVKEAIFFSVLADEVSSHNVEHLAMCLRFVDSECNIREEFVAFIKLSRVRASDIADSILTTLVNLGLSMSDLRGQGYDGASTMRGAKAGVQAQIRERQPMVLYTHCAGHSLNLAILSSCSIPCISNCIDQIKSLTLFVKHSPKREGLLKAIVSKNTEHTSNRSPLLNVCVTRWIENIDGWERFSTAHPFLVKMCEVILYGDPDYPVYNDNWPAEDKKNALAYLKALECFEFIYYLVTLSRTLLYLKNAVVKIQGVDQDIVSGVCSVMESCKELESVRKDVDNFSKRIFDHSSRIAEISRVSVSMPHVSMHQRHRANPEYISIEDYFKKTVTIPFLDHLISDVTSRFTSHSKHAASLQNLVPSNISADTSIDSIQQAVDFHSSDLPNPALLDEEFCRWKTKWLNAKQEDLPRTLAASLKQCDKYCLPNIFILLKLFTTLPLSSCSCERSASALRRLNNYMRCSQTEEL